MKKYYIKLKTGDSRPLNKLVAAHLHITLEEAEELIYWGAVWNNAANQRMKEAGFIVSSETIAVNKPDFPVTAYPFEKDDIIYEDPHILAVYKKPFFPTVPTPYSDINSLVYGINLYLRANNENYTALVINRLDLSARGLVLFAKNKKTEGKLHTLFKSRNIRKYYLAKTEKFQDAQKRYIIEDELEWNGKIRPARTIAAMIKETAQYYYFLVLPKTGRTHQIRKHFKHYIHPLYGDPVYGTYSRDTVLGLICFCYIFKHPWTEQKIKIRYLPDDF